MRAVPRLCEVCPGIYLTTEGKTRKNLSQGKRNLSQSTVYILPKHPHIKNLHTHTHTHTKHTHTHTHRHTHTQHTHTDTHTHTHTHITKQYKTTTIQIKTNTVQDIPK